MYVCGCPREQHRELVSLLPYLGRSNLCVFKSLAASYLEQTWRPQALYGNQITDDLYMKILTQHIRGENPVETHYH